MPGLEPGIHVAGAGTGGSVNGRFEPGHDAEEGTAIRLLCAESLGGIGMTGSACSRFHVGKKIWGWRSGKGANDVSGRRSRGDAI